MPLSAEDLRIVQDMKQREFAQKKRRRAANAMFHEARRRRALLLAIWTIAGAAVVAAAAAWLQGSFNDALPALWRETWPVLLIGAVLGWLAGSVWLRSPAGARLLDAHRQRLLTTYSGDLHAGRRWQQFFYKGEEISALIPLILYTLESTGGGRGGDADAASLDDVIAQVRATRVENPRFRARGLEIFNSLAAATDLVLLSTTDENGRPSSRYMRFVRSERPGVWYVTSAPEAPKIPEFDLGRASLVTIPDELGATISSNRVRLRRAGKSFLDVAELYRAQVPRYLDGMTDEDQAAEVVYELVIESARVSSWEYNEPVVFEANLTGSPASF
jgi:hypothetical protein